MAIIMLIGQDTVNEPYAYLNDIIGVFNDSFQFSDTELEIFNFLTVNGSVVDVRARLKEIQPEYRTACFTVENQKYEFQPDHNLTIDHEILVAHKPPNRWYKVVEEFKWPTNIHELTPEEKQVLATVDINHPSVDSFVNKLAKDIFALTGNDIEITDLKNQSYPI